MNKLPFLILYALFLLSGLSTVAAAVELTQLRCEYRSDPLGLDVAQPRLSWLSLESPYGRIATAWNVESAALQLDVTIPFNTTATVHVPTSDAASVTEAGEPVAKAKGVSFLRQDAGAAVYSIGAGSYEFRSALPATRQ